MNQDEIAKMLQQAPKADSEGRCPQCGDCDWIAVGIPGCWDYQCETCGTTVPTRPAKMHS